MVVAVQQPSPREDPLNSIMKGLSIAESVYGIVTNRNKLAQELKLAQAKASSEEEQRKVDIENKQAGTAKLKAETALLGKPKSEDLAKVNKENYDKAADLRNKYETHKTTQDTNQVLTAYEKVKLSATEPSAAGDLSLIFGYMKMLDPGSTVREGEFANAQNTGSVPDRIWNVYNRALSGERLNEKQREDFLSQSANVLKGQLKSQEVIDKRFKDFAKQWNIDTRTFIPEKYDILNERSQKLAEPRTFNIPGEAKARAEEPWSVESYLTKSPN